MFLKSLTFIFTVCAISSITSLDPDASKGPLKLIRDYGYPVEEVRVTTEDGIRIVVHRIKHGLENENEHNKRAILLMHDILSSSADFVNVGTRSLAFQLADMNYDVWLANARGNTYSKLDASVDGFWDFSWHAIGYYDIPSIIDTMIETTGVDGIYYIGHGQGTTSFYVMASERPDYNNKVKLMISLSPVAFNLNVPNPVLRLVNGFAPLENIVGTLTSGPILDPSLISILSFALPLVCDDDAFLVEICSLVLYLVCGFDSAQMEKSKVSVILTNAPAGASVKQVYHYAQLFYTGHFRQFDYGEDENLVIYGSETPPDYNLGQITTPVGLFYGSNDWLASISDVETLASKLPNIAMKYKIPYADFNHLDFLFALDIQTLLYDKVFKLLEEY